MTFPRGIKRPWQWGLVAVALGACGLAAAQEETDEQPYLPGLIATFKSSDGRELRRIDESLPANDLWGNDVRLSGISEARWKGLLWAQGAGEYRLHVVGRGPIEVRLAGKVVINEHLPGGWFSSEPVTLSFDYHPLEIHIPRHDRYTQLSLFWSGPQFGVEPIAPRYLWHDRKETVSPDFERGRLLNVALRCSACHALREDKSLSSSPSLANLRGNLNRQWLIDWLMQGEHTAPAAEDGDEGAELRSVSRRMPLYVLPHDQAEAIASYLLARQGDPPQPKPLAKSPLEKPATGKTSKSKKEDKTPEKQPPSARDGQRLFLTLGCLACHQQGDLGESGLFGGGDLTNVVIKRPADFFARWLADPASINRHHRMPVFDLTADERTSLALFLARSDGGKPSRAGDHKDESSADEAQIDRGRELINKLRCGSCHEVPEDQPKFAADEKMILDDQSDWSRSCAGPKKDARSGWGYDLPAEYRQWLTAYFKIARSTREALSDGEQLVLKSNCLACHAREGFSVYDPILPARLADKLAAVGHAHEELAALIPAMTPPSLNGVGDKLTSTALSEAIRRAGAPYRSYLLVRMPKFALDLHSESALRGYFWSLDQLPRGAPITKTESQPNESALAAAGGRLVSTDGFGCVSCHQIGSVVPDKAPLNARGPALSQIDKRIRREWFDRFVPNPSRIVPRMEMPSVQIPVKGVLGDNVHQQLAAVWHVLSKPGFEPPEPNPVRVLRASGIAERKEPPIVINDVVKLGEQVFVQPLVIGLPNRQNFLYDLDAGRFTAWWLGDTARQRTKGKSWHWEPGGPMVMAPAGKMSELTIIRDGKKLVPVKQGQHVAEIDGYQVSDGGVQATYRLKFGNPDRPDEPTVAAEVADQWLPSRGAGSWRSESLRILRIVPTFKASEQVAIAVRLVPKELAGKGERSRDGRSLRFSGDAGGAEITLYPGMEDGWSLAADGIVTSQPFSTEGRGMLLAMHYRSALTPDLIDAEVVSFPVEADAVEIAPGLVGRRLPLPGDLMPTALAWRKDPASPAHHELVTGSLKGQVIAARDTDGDGLEDSTRVIADGLATPYGIADGGDALHALTKSALLEVKDGAVKVLASGWGHTDDYHDWAVGLPRNEKEEYFVGLPCQQDERSAAAAKYRGAILKLTPRKPTDDNPHRYEIAVVSTGHRFPMGMDLSRDGELFVTDNQGNYNPFNELNHVRQGAFFGFINANEKKDKSFKPPPLDAPAIDIPHPWTRSVNGICFLNTPPVARRSAAEGHAPEATATESRATFGPLEGHLIGCEYDTRRLVRMTLQKVGNTYQGAAYPLSLEPSSPEKGFLGPVVCAVSPRGELYVGSIRDSGWGAGNNTGEVVQVKIMPEGFPAGIAEVRAVRDGFEIDFFREVDAGKAADAANYAITSYRRESTPAYGGPDLDRRIEKVTGIEVSVDRRRATVTLAQMRAGFVYELQLKNLTADGRLFHPAEAHYTLRTKPE